MTGGARHLVLVGLMGAGKSTVGRRAAAALGWPLVDSDRVIEARTGRSVREIWLTDGEPAFRALEEDALRSALLAKAPTVIAAAGGVVLSPGNRRALQEADAVVVWLDADPVTLVGRARRGAHRPLLDKDPESTLRTMAAARRSLYREVADIVVDVGERTAEEIAVDVVDALGHRSMTAAGVTTVRVPLGSRSYEVHVGAGAIGRLAELVGSSAKRVAVITQAGIPFGDAGHVARQLDGLAVEITRIEIGRGEAQKSLTTVEHIAGSLADAGITRHDVVIGIGGGMVTDVAGFAAAIWHRGVRVVHVATTLLGMVDAAIGGKTGVNTRAGKNLVGAFWQPAGVICDLDALATLPDRERRSGDGEMAKYHFLTGEDLDRLPLADRIARCVAIKAAVVAGDEREDPGLVADATGRAGGRSSPGRAVLNYGHTLAHALEIATDHALTHGEAVGIGLVFAAQLAHQLGRVGSGRVDRHRDVVGGTYRLSTTIPAGLDAGRLLELMARDKKAIAGLTFVLDGPNGIEAVADVDPADARRALDACS